MLYHCIVRLPNGRVFDIRSSNRARASPRHLLSGWPRPCLVPLTATVLRTWSMSLLSRRAMAAESGFSHLSGLTAKCWLRRGSRTPHSGPRRYGGEKPFARKSWRVRRYDQSTQYHVEEARNANRIAVLRRMLSHAIRTHGVHMQGAS